MGDVHSHGGNPDLAHHFENMEQQRESSKLGMWLFLATEILFFGGLFCAYIVYRVLHPEVFIFGHHFLDKTLGAINTVVLIWSSLTMAWAVRAAQLRQRGILQLMLVLSFIFAGTFLGIKYVEYSHKWKHGLLWAAKYSPDPHVLEEAGVAVPEHPGDEAPAPAGAAPTAATTQSVSGEATAAEGPEAVTTEPEDPDESKIGPAATGPSGLAADDESEAGANHLVVDPANARTFFSIYFLMTGLHGIHVILGMAAMIWLFKLTRQGFFDGGNFSRVDVVALYWHLVDIIWIYLFLLLYLIE